VYFDALDFLDQNPVWKNPNKKLGGRRSSSRMISQIRCDPK
jgi:hypothetical protein